ncbi:GlxA family transcriptional regulator [Candidatus Pantoea multigeneris]|uniref:AraC family transcriptional regulator n=1 Tax=Candidatus Pantoea multigeneris TaxID=2608357 RepID=A0ABX0RGD9_9GAMM|nr:helix-turn-helix domain-containing protein [Pantoea multigeneris]NIF24383.1 AraC family transcriptional regulator [Pantoea multigeneris]
MTKNVQIAPFRPAIRVGVVVFDGIIPFHLSVPLAVFEAAHQGEGVPCYQIHICATQPGELRTSSGFSIVAGQGLEQLEQMDVVVVPSWNEKQPSAELLSAIRQAADRGATIVGLCLGAFVLAEAGLLEKKRATTHWRWMQAFSTRYPSVDIDRDVLYVDLGQTITSAGTAASIDCCLHLVRRSWGMEIANQVARMLVIPPHRQGGQAQYVEQPVITRPDGDRFMAALHWAAEHLQEPLTLQQLANQALMSSRSFSRRFQQTTGGCFSQWLQQQRIALAQRYLEGSNRPVEQIALLAGFPSALALRRHFKKQLNVTPQQYRKTFRGQSGTDVA